MPIERVYFDNFRLFKKKEIFFSKNLNIVIGPNGSGKTTILEAIELLIKGRSFRANSSKECINNKSETFTLACKGKMNEKEISLKVTNNKKGRLASSRKSNDKRIKKVDLPFLQTVIAKSLRMVEGEPDIRREYFNNLMFHVKPGSSKIYDDFNKILKNRNRCLKNKAKGSELDVWTKQFIVKGLELSKTQFLFYQEVKKHLSSFFDNPKNYAKFRFLKNTEIKFVKGWERSKALSDSLLESEDRDALLGYTSKGPHRMDYEFITGGKLSSSNLSRGQLKILILLVFLENQKFLESCSGLETILLVDDLGSELDRENLELILSEIHLSTNQIILTGISDEILEKIVGKLGNFKGINI